MRYRMEVIEDELVIRNVDMDIRLGTAVPIYFYDQDRQRSIIRACTVLNKDGDDIATIPTTVPRPLEKAAAAIANLRGSLWLSRLQGRCRRLSRHAQGRISPRKSSGRCRFCLCACMHRIPQWRVKG